MSTADRLSRSSIRAAVERVLDEIDENLLHELKRKEEVWRDKYDALQADAKGIRQRLAAAETAKLRLKDGNHRLSMTVDLLTAALNKTTSASPVATRTSNAVPLAAAAASVTQESSDGRGSDASVSAAVTDLQQRLDTALARYNNAKKNLEALVDVARRRKTEVVQWIEYAESLEVKVKRLEKKLADKTTKAGKGDKGDRAGKMVAAAAGSAGSAAPPTPANAAENPAPVEVQKPSLSASFSSSFLSSFLSGLDGDLDEEAASGADHDAELPSRSSNGAAATARASTHEASLDSTQSDPLSDGHNLEQGPELPTPRAAHPEHSGHCHGGVIVKHEPLSDGPEILWERPAKRQRRDDSAVNRNPLQHRVTEATTKVKKEAADNAAVTWPPASTCHESQESLDLDEGQLAIPTPRKRQLVFHDIPSQTDTESANSSQPATQENVDERPVHSAARSGGRPPGTPLATVSVNASRVPRTGVSSARKDSAEYAKQLKRGVESLRKDGERRQPPKQQQAAAGAISAPSSEKASRLWSLLHNTSRGGISPLAKTPRRAGGGGGSGAAAAASPRSNRAPGRTATSSVATASTPKTPFTAATTPLATSLLAAKDAAASVAKKGPPLRMRPVDQLTLLDFKINPARNDGETFAYNEVVRNRSDRGGLAGCTDPQCCGKVFRSMAASELEAVASAGTSSSCSPSSSAVAAYVNRPDSVVMMEQFLGDKVYGLAQMAPGEKRQLWLEARTHQLANKYGKHRHRFHRRASPPGFWDADFPTSQEEERYRAESAKQEKAAILERYREAMHPGGGGRWLFRDE